MGLYNEILAPRYARALQKLTGIKGSPPTRQLSGDIFACLDMFYGVENLFLESWNRFGLASQVAAVAAQNSGFRLRNPSASNVIVVIEDITINNSNATAVVYAVNVGAQNADLGTSENAFISRLDSRQISPRSAASFSQGNNFVASGFTFWNNQLPSNGIADVVSYEGQQVCILPGDALDITATTVNSVANVSVLWRERALEESERS